MAKTIRTYGQWRLEKLSDPDRAARYLNAARRDSKEALLHAVKNVIQAHQVARVAREAGVSRESVYRSFSAAGNPTFDTLDSVLAAVGIKITFEANQGQANPTPPQPVGRPIQNKTIAAAKATSGFRSGLLKVQGAGGIGKTAIAIAELLFVPSPDAGNSINNALHLTQGTESWHQKMTLQWNPSHLIFKGQTTLPPATQTTYNLSQACGI
jgi:probable addiction module antidote protein